MISPSQMNRKQVEDWTTSYELLINYCRMVALLPVDEWLAELEHAETIAAITDPTLYRKYIYSSKPEVLKKIMVAALELKRVMEKVQEDAKKEEDAHES